MFSSVEYIVILVFVFKKKIKILILLVRSTLWLVNLEKAFPGSTSTRLNLEPREGKKIKLTIIMYIALISVKLLLRTNRERERFLKLSRHFFYIYSVKFFF